MPAESPLNPGVPPRKRSSLCKFSLWIGLILGALFLARILVGIGQQLFWFTSFSHSRIYQNQTLGEVKNRAAVVRPLIDEHQTFDIAVSIWTLPADGRDGERIGDVAESPLYSDIVFRGVLLSDKHIQSTLHYRLPVALFRRLLLKESDLRAAFVAIPTSPSLLDRVTNFTTWRPETMRIPPVRSWPFPLGAADKGPQSVADRALDSFGISMPLLEFHEFPTKCDKQGHLKSSTLELDDEDMDDVDEAEKYEETVEGGHGPGVVVSDVARHPEHAVKRHPFIVTRTQIRVVDEVHILNRKAYNKEHNKLKLTSCGQERNAVPDYNLCHRRYITNGNWETRLELQVPNEGTGHLQTEWAYAPYVGYGWFSAGPKDIVPIPVTREKCMEFKDPSATDPEFIDISWQLSYSGRSPAKFSAGELFSSSERVKHHESEYKKAKAQDKAELWNGIYGHRFYEDAHPRRRLIISALVSVLSFIVTILDLGYWYTRTSTAFISVSGSIFLALSGILAAFTDIANTVETDKLGLATATSRWAQWLWLIVMTAVTQLSLPVMMLQTVTRMEFRQNESTLFPSIRLATPTHKERNSERLDARTSWGVKAGVCISLVAVYYFFSPEEYHLLSAHHPHPGSSDQPTNSLARTYAILFGPLQLTGTLAQLLLNYRAKTFAGSYKAAIGLRAVIMVLALGMYVPTVVGRFDARPGLAVSQIVEMVALAVALWQAAVFPKVVQKVGDEDSE
ncbi:hypothetical protein DFH06DRAFT_1185007 [Mycena polygramma]|nr:hypothetical protein DFH06DRAFT_1185007 [Mycena polygramma]